MTISYWQKRKSAAGAKRNLPAPPDRCDIAVIGGGLIGTATAHYLKKFGCDRVVVLEKNFIGYGASGRNAGFILSGLAEPYSRLVVAMGRESARELMKSTLENHDLIAEAVEDKSIRCGYSRSGSYHLAITEAEKSELHETVDLMVSDGFDVEFRSEVRGAAGERLKKFMGGFFNPADGKLDPFAFVNGLSEGLDAVEGFDVRSITRQNGLLEIAGSDKKVRAEMAVIAVNAYAPLLDRYFENLVFPVRGQMLATSPMKKNLLGHSTYYANFGYDYFRQVDDQAVIMGGLRDRFVEKEVGYDDITNPDLQKGLEEYIENRLGIGEFSVESRWGGVMGFTIDGLPLVGALPHNSSVVAAVGYNGHGFGLGMLVARDLARAIMRNETSDILRRFSLKRISR